VYFLFQLPSGPSDYEAVMVFFHGGGFGFGSGNTELFGPDYLLEAGVVFVSVNYRLGPLGK
jgi:carboxylesterase type B